MSNASGITGYFNQETSAGAFMATGLSGVAGSDAPISADSAGNISEMEIGGFAGNLLEVLAARIGLDKTLNDPFSASASGPANQGKAAQTTASNQQAASDQTLPFGSRGTAVHQTLHQETAPQLRPNESLQPGTPGRADIKEHIDQNIDQAQGALKEIQAQEEALAENVTAAEAPGDTMTGNIGGMAASTMTGIVVSAVIPVAAPFMMAGAATSMALKGGGGGSFATFKAPTQFSGTEGGKSQYKSAASEGTTTNTGYNGSYSSSAPAPPAIETGFKAPAMKTPFEMERAECTELSLAGISRIKCQIQGALQQSQSADYNFARWDNSVQATVHDAAQKGLLNETQADKMTENGDMDIAAAVRSGPLPHKMAAMGMSVS